MKLTKTMSLLLAAILGIGTLASCAVDDGHVSPEQGGTTAAITVESNEGSVTAELEDLTYVSLRINPEIELIADEDGNVVSANAVNEDGEVVLATVDLEGKSIEEAGAIFTETSNDLGYFTPDGE